MGKTKLEIKGEKFLINGKEVYSEIEGSNPNSHGLLMNARFIQGIFDDKADRNRFHRFGRKFDPDQNTNDLIAALPEWYKYGLRAFTVGFQGGGLCFTIDNKTIENNPFGSDGLHLDPEYAARMDRLIKAADEIGMVVIVSYFYPGQTDRFADAKAILNAVRTASRFLKNEGYTNVIIEVCNEHNITWQKHPLIYEPEGMVALMEIARNESGGMPVGCSSTAGFANFINEQVCRESDVVLIHGNGLTRQGYYNAINQVKSVAPGKPIVCNEDSQAIGQLEVAIHTQTSWGYYNNMTKQEPPVHWGITHGEDLFFAYRMAEGIGIQLPPIPEDEQYVLQGLEADNEYEGNRWIRLSSLYPEKINYVDFYRNSEKVYTCYVEPFTVNFQSNWRQFAWTENAPGDEWEAVIHLKDGRTISKRGTI